MANKLITKPPTPAERKAALIGINPIIKALNAAITDPMERGDSVVQGIVSNDLKKTIAALPKHHLRFLPDAVMYLRTYMTGDEITKIRFK